MGKAEPNTRTETRSAWRGRDREREKAMVFLDVLVNYGCRRWLHKEDYTFDEGEVGDKMSSSSKPSQYPLLGFKDRKLEEDYFEYLVVASRARIILGYVTVILLYGLGPFAANFVVYDRGIQLQDD